MRKYIYFLLITASFEISAGGLDLTLLYGTRYIAMGGAQVSLVNDAYAPFYNPAGMMGVESGALVLHSSNLFTQYSAPIGAADAQRKSSWGLGPLFYVGSVYRLSDRLSIGLGVYPTALQGGKFSNVAFGSGILANKAIGNRLVRIEVAPSIAYKLHPNLYVGAAYRLGYTRYEKQGGNFSVPFHLKSTLDGYDAKGLKFGAMLDRFHGFSAGLTYRPKMSIDLEGTTTIAISGTSQGLAATQEVAIPAQLQAGLSYEWIRDRFVTAFCYEFTQNSVIENDVTQVPGMSSYLGTNTLTSGLHYRDSHTYHVGGEYTFHFKDGQKVRAGMGFAYDAAVTRKAFPNPALPPAEAYLGYAVGGQYERGRHTVGMSVNYGQYSSRSSSIDSSLANQVYTGKYALEAVLVSADYQLRF